jgi:DNA polymerase
MDKVAVLAEIAQDLLRAQDAPLLDYRTTQRNQVVIGEGSANADIMFIGEAPGYHEAKQGRPFVGASGTFLDELLRSVGLERQDIFITNILKDRPPNNRAPRKPEITYYTPYLDRQIAIIQPRVIVTLGRFAMEYILKKFDAAEKDGKISTLHGQVITAQAPYGAIHIVPLFHPAVALYDESKRQTLIDDFLALKTVTQR